MYKVYWADAVIEFLPDNGTAATTPSADYELTNLMQKLEKTKRLTFISSDPDADFARFASQFRPITAAGGLTLNPEGRTLMIYRNNRWDLPKGKLEPGEDIMDCAVREVEEETGINGVSIVRYLTNTYHLYTLNGETILKRTEWYLMSCDGTAEPAPQVEEGITIVEWAAEDVVKERLKESYGTIIDVFAANGIV